MYMYVPVELLSYDYDSLAYFSETFRKSILSNNQMLCLPGAIQ